MKDDLSIWGVLFNVVVAALWGVYTLAKGRQTNEQTLVENADRWERLARERNEENVSLRERMKRDEADIQRLEERYQRLMRRYVEQEDYMREVLEFCESRAIKPPARRNGT